MLASKTSAGDASTNSSLSKNNDSCVWFGLGGIKKSLFSPLPLHELFGIQKSLFSSTVGRIPAALRSLSFLSLKEECHAGESEQRLLMHPLLLPLPVLCSHTPQHIDQSPTLTYMCGGGVCVCVCAAHSSSCFTAGGAVHCALTTCTLPPPSLLLLLYSMLFNAVLVGYMHVCRDLKVALLILRFI